MARTIMKLNPSHGVGVGAADPVVALADGDLLEAETGVEPDRRFVVGAPPGTPGCRPAKSSNSVIIRRPMPLPW